MNESLTFLKEYCDFSNPDHVWIMTGIARNKDNEESASFFHRMILAKEEDIQEAYDFLKGLANESGVTYRIYISLNSRNIVESTFNFQKRLIDISIGLAKGQPDAKALAKKLGSVWKKELAQKSNRGTKRFLLDVDNLERHDTNILYKFTDYKDFEKTKIHTVRPTSSGFAIVIDACDVRGILEYAKELGLEVDKQVDSMVYVESWTI